MITLRHIIYHSNDDPDTLFSRLSWRTERKENLFWELFSKKSIDSTKTWVGFYDRNKMEFNVTEPVKLLNPWWLQVTAQGEIIQSTDKVIVNVKLRPTVLSLLFWCTIYIVGGVKLLNYLLYNTPEDPTNLLLFLFFGPVLGTCLIILKLNSVETELDDSMGIR